MKEFSKILLKEYRDEFKKYKDFLDTNHWWEEVYEDVRTGKLKSSKLDTEVSIIKTVVTGVNKFLQDIGEDAESKPVQDFVKFTSGIISQHIKGIQKYKNENPLDSESTESDVGFHSDLFALITKTKVDLSKLNIDETEAARKSIDLFYGNSKAPLAMRELLCDTFPVINDRTEKLGIDFYAPSINPMTSNELFINMKPRDIPEWDVKKHYFEQEKSTIQFWEEELRKIKNGVNLYGYHLSDWLYWHMNHFKLSYIDDEKGKIVHQPLLRDNEYYFDEMYRKAELDGRVALFMFGTRRFAKSVSMASKIYHKLFTITKCQATIQGFSAIPDLKAIIDYISDSVEAMHPALRIPANSMNLEEGAVLGLKGKKAQDRYDLAKLTVVNLEGGTSRSSTQKTAGSTPDVFVFDEVAKGKCIAPWKAALPSFEGGPRGKWRLTPILSATAGEAALSADAEKMLKDPLAYSIMPMDWDLLESMVDPDYITWERNTFGMFVPAQMSLAAPPKINQQFSDFLDIDNPALSEINIKVTDWEAAKEFFHEERAKLSNDLAMLTSYQNSFPLETSDCYLTTEVNIFPGLECKVRKDHIVKEGLTGEKYRFHRDSIGEIQATMVPEQPLIELYPYEGGSFDAPPVMLENPLLRETPPPIGLYVIGFDDVKVDKSSGDSVISATVFKRGYEGGEWANRIVGWYDSRPDRKQTYYKQLYLMMKAYNARVLYENADNGFIEYVETHHPEDVALHFSTGVGLASEENMNLNKNRKYGWSPTPHNIYLALQKVVMYTKEENIVIGDQDGLGGVERINHPMLLEEMYKHKKGINADRIRSFSLALTLARYYDNTYQYMSSRRHRLNDSGTVRKKTTRSSYGGIVYDSRLNRRR